MRKFRKKPVVIEAVQFDGTIQMAMTLHKQYGDTPITDPDTDAYLGAVIVETLAGGVVVSKDDWILTGVKNERYPCKPDIFEATYDEV